MSLSKNARTIVDFSSFIDRLSRDQDRWVGLLGINYKEFMILLYLEDSPGHVLKRIDLADKVGLSASGVTRILNPMEKVGLVTRDTNPRDARVSLVKLAPGGLGVLADAKTSVSQGVKTLLNGFTAEQQAALALLSAVRW